MKFKEFKFDKGWKILIYFDFVIPIVLFLLAYLIPQVSIKSLFSTLFHSYNIYIVKPIPHLASLTGIIGLLYHAGIIGYTIKRKNLADLMICAVITLLIAVIFFFEFNYMFIKPLNFS